MSTNRPLLIGTIFIILIIIIILIIVIVSRSCEGFSYKTATIVPTQDGIFLANFNNFAITTSPTNQDLHFHIDKHFIQLIQSPHSLYLDFERIHLIQTVYKLFLKHDKNEVQHKWYFKKISDGSYYIYQRIKKKKIYLHIENKTLVGSHKDKTAFRIHGL